MGNYKGDYAEDATVRFSFNTKDGSGGPVSPDSASDVIDVEVYKDHGTTQITAGITVTEDFDSVTGLVIVEVDMSADAAYTAGSDYMAVISVGTAGTISIVGDCVAEWSCENRHNEVNVTQWRGETVPATNQTGRPLVDLTHVNGTAASGQGTAAISAAVWDRLKTSHTVSGSFGEHLQNPFTVDEIQSAAAATIATALIDATELTPINATTTGLGASITNITIRDTSSNTIADAEVWVTATNNSRAAAVASGTTDGNGLVIFRLDPGTYYVWAQKAGVNFDQPQIITITPESG